jgi:hypothetical protein
LEVDPLLKSTEAWVIYKGNRPIRFLAIDSVLHVGFNVMHKNCLGGLAMPSTIAAGTYEEPTTRIHH